MATKDAVKKPSPSQPKAAAKAKATPKSAPKPSVKPASKAQPKVAPKTTAVAKATAKIASAVKLNKTGVTKAEPVVAAVAPKAPTVHAPVLPKEVFDVKVSPQAIFDTVISEQSAVRQGTHAVKNRAAVRGGGKKPYAQKGTGQARAGSIRSPIWVGGGIVFGPNTERNYKLKVNRKVKRLAFNSALTMKAKDHAIIVQDVTMDKPSTKSILKLVESWNLKKEFKKILIVSDNENTYKSARNLQNVHINKFAGLTVQMIVNSDVVVLNPDHIKKLEGLVK